VAQLYISVPDPEGNQPQWSLKDFQRVNVAAGSSKTVVFNLDRNSLEQFNEEGDAALVPGTYTLYVGNGSPGERSQELGVNMVSSSFLVN